MPNRQRRSRATDAELRGRLRAVEVARRLGTSLREARLASGHRQIDVATAAGISQPWVSLLERGFGAGASLETWASVASATGAQLVGFLEGIPGADRPRDHAHLRRQELVIRTARRGGWRARPEAPIDPGPLRSRSIDVLLVREARQEIAVVEVWDWFDDVGAALRSLDGKVDAVGQAEAAVPRVGGLWVVRATKRNRALVAEFRELFRARFPAPSTAWLGALTTENHPMPHGTGFLWTDVAGERILASRIGA